MKRKIIAAIVASSMILTIAGCSQTKAITINGFTKAAESLGCEEIDPEDLEEDFTGDIEDGFYTVVDADYIEDEMDLESALESYELDDIIDADTVSGIAILAKGTGADELEDLEDPEDFEDYQADIVYVVTVEFSEKIDVQDVMDALADNLDKADIDVDDLSSSEWLSSANAGYFRENIDFEDLATAILDNEDIADIIEYYDEDGEITDTIEAISGQACVNVEVTRTSMTVAVGIGVNSDASTFATVSNKLGLKNVTGLKTNTELLDGLVETVFETYGSALSHSYEVDQVVDEIDEQLGT